MREAHVPTEQPKAEEEARVPRPHALQRWARGHSVASSARPEAAVSLIWRVRDREAFAALSRARRLRRGPLTLRYVPDPEHAPPRVAYAIGRAVGGAVARTRARRRLRAALQQLEARLPAGSYLFGADDRVVTMPFLELVSTLTELVDEIDTAS